jgi:hypothetical protein
MNRQSQWLFEAPLVAERDRETNLYSNPEDYSNSEWEWESKAIPRPAAVQPTERSCNERGIPGRIPVRGLTISKVKCTKAGAFGVTNPFGVVSRAVKRALVMLDKTIDELVDARKVVCSGATPASTLRGITLCLLKNGLSVNTDDIRVWTADAFENRSVAEVIRRLIRVRNQIAENDNRYFCDNGRCDPGDPTSGCVPGDWAFICRPDPCPKGAEGMDRIIHLCRNFWIPAVRKNGKPVPPEIHAEFQSQTIIHETSHLYHCTKERGHTIGIAECLSQFVAATNGSPIDLLFSKFCVGMNRCFPAGEVREFETSELEVARPGAFRVAKTVFRPQNAIWLKGRSAVRR